MAKDLPLDELRRGPMALDPVLDPLRLPPSDRCWWCGDRATTEEHRFKLSTLRRVARADTGREDPSTVFKKSDDWEGSLRSIKKGAQVRWRKNMCAKCNNQRSQPFDLAYETMEAFIVTHADDMMRWPTLRWADVYGAQWQKASADLARYFGKQLGCMLATQRLPLPPDLIDFLNGAKRCPPVAFMLLRNWRAGDMHRAMIRDGFDDGVTHFVGLLPATAYSREGRFAAVDYVYHIGYVWFCVNWTEGTDRSSWWEYAVSTCRWSMEIFAAESTGGSWAYEKGFAALGAGINAVERALSRPRQFRFAVPICLDCSSCVPRWPRPPATAAEKACLERQP